MKKTILALLTLALIGAGVQTAKAGDREWALAGKVLTGLVAVSVVSHALEPAPVYACSPNYHAYSSPAYSRTPAPTVVYATPPTVVYAPPPAVVYAPAPTRVVVYRQPVYAAPAPVVSFRFNFGPGHYHHRRGCW